MKDHKDKGILQIDYNFLNLPKYIRFDKTFVPRFSGMFVDYNVNTRYTYRADGIRLKKIYTYGSGKTNIETSTVTDYLDGFQYEENNDGNLSIAVLKFVPTAEGYYDFEKNKYIYSYTDHLGNIRVSYFKNTNGSAEVLEENNFYPFGMKHEGYNQTAGNPAYSYQYNGKELQKETGWSDYGARMYMSDIARWGVIDPLAEQMRRYSPYTYAYNNPIRFIDPDGRKPQTQEDEIKTVMYPDTMLMFYASGGSTNNRALMQFVGLPDNIGNFFVAMDKLNSVNSKGGGGGGGSSTGANSSSTSSSNEQVDVELQEVTITGKRGVSSYNMLSLHLALLNAIERQLDRIDRYEWYGPAGKGNFGFGTTATTIGFIQGSFRLTNGIYNGSAWSPKYYPSAWIGGSRARITTYNFGKIGRGLGRFSVGIGVIMDIKGMQVYSKDPNSPNAVHPYKMILNSVMGAVGSEGGAYGAIISTFYFGIDNFYPGGWGGNAEHPGVFNDQSRLNQENSFNPYWQLYPGAMKQ
ncbi:RHS repeat-associated core domain-containing protein [Chryseobacterium sp. PS-8]|uniref:RHS repeat-associated core domain-containing protein n=1 Tax=Chryseobacterium indicum TaxID=2766954 RepID=A0ABS9C2B6_9FLAO|nr:RHS repeat-associated core domain-containing protein [Chryseobacterium sp. PS-8]